MLVIAFASFIVEAKDAALIRKVGQAILYVCRLSTDMLRRLPLKSRRMELPLITTSGL